MAEIVPGCVLQNLTPSVTAASSASTGLSGTVLPKRLTDCAKELLPLNTRLARKANGKTHNLPNNCRPPLKLNLTPTFKVPQLFRPLPFCFLIGPTLLCRRQPIDADIHKLPRFSHQFHIKSGRHFNSNLVG